MITPKSTPRVDCAFYCDGECRATITTCNRAVPCGFYKTVDQHEKSCGQAYKRISKLTQEKQDYISEKYYGCTKPWLEE